MEKNMPESTYEVIDPELTIISEKGDLGVQGKSQVSVWQQSQIKSEVRKKGILNKTENINIC